jgi:hypothetical protein
VTDSEFESLVQRLPNPVVTSNGGDKFLTVGTVTYVTALITKAAGR